MCDTVIATIQIVTNYATNTASGRVTVKYKNLLIIANFIFDIKISNSRVFKYFPVNYPKPLRFKDHVHAHYVICNDYAPG